LVAVVVFGLFWLVLYTILRLQGVLPFNPLRFSGAPWNVTFNTTSSFISNTNWQYYGGETTMSHFSQMAGLAVQNFVSAAVGMAVLAAVIRGFARRDTDRLGNFWVDLTRSLLYILLPLSVIGTLLLVSQGVVQTFTGSVTLTSLHGFEQVLALGPVASQIAIKQLGTNGGGFFDVNSSFPFENAHRDRLALADGGLRQLRRGARRGPRQGPGGRPAVAAHRHDRAAA
jgi:potassium-transporting ATPase potassium-binding subunit